MYLSSPTQGFSSKPFPSHLPPLRKISLCRFFNLEDICVTKKPTTSLFVLSSTQVSF